MPQRPEACHPKRSEGSVAAFWINVYEQPQIIRSALQKENVYVICFLSAYQGQPPRLSMLRMTET